MVALLPAVVLSAAALRYTAGYQQAQVRNASAATLRALMSAVDTELSRSWGVVEALASSPALTQGDLRTFQAASRRVLELQPNWTTVVLYDPRGRQIMNTAYPVNGPNASRAMDPESFAEVLEKGRPTISSIFVDRGSQVPLFSIRVPVLSDDSIAYVVSATVRPESVLKILNEQGIDPEAVVSVIDAGGKIVARSRNHAEFVGKSPSPEFWKLLQESDEGWVPSTTLDGRTVYTAFLRSDWSGWRMIYGIPEAVVHQTARGTSLMVAAGLLLSIILGFAGAMLIARRIAAPIARLREGAEALGRGEDAALPSTDLEEVNALSLALRDAAAHRKQAELVLQDALRRAEAANVSKDHFLAMLGHELRSPLAPMANAVEMLRLAGDRPDQAARAREIMGRQLAHMTRLVDDLLDISRVTRGVIELKMATVAIQDVIDQVLETCRPQIDKKQQTLKISLPGEKLLLLGDQARLSQSLCNVLNNAAKYTGEGGNIALEVSRQDDWLLVKISDDGSGMDAAELGRAFELFFQGASARGGSGGLGLGLALVKQIITSHGGTIEARSEGPGRGSQFIVRLPLKREV
jgi:signal transduction histidine kinase